MEERQQPALIVAALLVLLAVMYLTWLYFARTSDVGPQPAPVATSLGR